jgi:hypothetical protein
VNWREMDISVLYNGKRYKFCDITGSMKWIDNRNIIVPIILSNELRKRAVAEGFDPEIFNTKKINKPEGDDGIEEVEWKVAKVKVRNRKGSVTGGLNLASLIENIGDKNE